jgi:hypothetical protein
MLGWQQNATTPTATFEDDNRQIVAIFAYRKVGDPRRDTRQPQDDLHLAVIVS